MPPKNDIQTGDRVRYHGSVYYVKRDGGNRPLLYDTADTTGLHVAAPAWRCVEKIVEPPDDPSD